MFYVRCHFWLFSLCFSSQLLRRMVARVDTDAVEGPVHRIDQCNAPLVGLTMHDCGHAPGTQDALRNVCA